MRSNNQQETSLFSKDRGEGVTVCPITAEYRDGIYFGKLSRREDMQGLGIVLYDNGDILVGLFEQSALKGEYMYYDCTHSLMFYGQVINKKLTNSNFVYSRKNSYLKADFISGKILHETSKIKNRYKADFLTPKNLQKNNSSLPFFSSANNPHIHSQFTKVTTFLQKMATHQNNRGKWHNRSQETEEEMEINMYEINKNQKYFGALLKDKPEGYGIIFVDEWPVCYGYFEQGQLNGMARVEQNALLILDGFFKESRMLKGWIIDHKHKTTGFGIYDQHKEKFQLMEQMNSISNTKVQEKITQTRKQYHLQSLLFINDYAPNLDPYYFWPQNSLEQIRYEQTIHEIMHNFAPSYISQISRVAQLSSHRLEKDLIDLIKEHNEQKNSHIRVSRILETRLKKFESESKSIERNSSIKQREYGTRKKLAIQVAGTQHVTRGRRQQTSKKKLNLDKIYSKHLRR